VPGYQDAIVPNTVTPSGFAWLSANFTTTAAAANTILTLRSVRFNAATLTPTAAQPIRGGHANANHIHRQSVTKG
jgi:hypothetical protein